MDNKYVRGAVIVVVGMAILVGLLFLGDVLATATSGGQAFGMAAQPALGEGNPLQGGWLPWVIIGGVLLYVIYVFFADSEMFKVGTREVVMMALGAALYGVLAWIFNIVPVPSVSLVALRPVVVIPIFFGFVFGPAVGFFTGAFGNILGDALTGWGVFPIWDIGNGLMGLIPGLAGLYFMKKQGEAGRVNVLQWVALAVLAIAVILPFVSPQIVGAFSGETEDASGWGPVMIVVLIVVAGLTFAPQYWPAVLILLTLVFFGLGGRQLNNPPEGADPVPGAIVMFAIGILCALGAWYVHSKAKDITKWMDDTDTRTLVVWASIGVIVGIGFAAMADIIYNGYSFTTAFIGEFIPAAGPNILFAVVLTPLLFAAYKQARAGMGR
jgi:energy-coupling factor transport system substrate-specific component